MVVVVVVVLVASGERHHGGPGPSIISSAEGSREMDVYSETPRPNTQDARSAFYSNLLSYRHNQTLLALDMPLPPHIVGWWYFDIAVWPTV